MSSVKTRNTWGVLRVVEASYGAGGSPSAATDGVLVNEEPNPAPDWVHDGSRAGDSGMMRTIQRTGRHGREYTAELVIEAAGAGAAYSATVRPTIDRELRAGGYTATGTFTGGSEKFDYTPDKDAFESLFYQLYARGQLYPILGAYIENYTFTFEGPQIPVWTFPIRGIGSTDPTDAALPAITYPSLVPPKAISVALTIGTYNGGVIRSVTFNPNRELERRLDDNVAGHAGFTPAMFDPEIVIVMEADTLATGSPWHTAGTINPYKLIELGTALSFSMTIGSTQYNRYKLAAGAFQISNLEESEAGPIALWTITGKFRDSAPGAFDNHTWTFD